MRSLRVLLAATAILALPALVVGCRGERLSEEDKAKALQPAKGPADKADKDDHSIKNE